MLHIFFWTFGLRDLGLIEGSRFSKSLRWWGIFILPKVDGRKRTNAWCRLLCAIAWSWNTQYMYTDNAYFRRSPIHLTWIFAGKLMYSDQMVVCTIKFFLATSSQSSITGPQDLAKRQWLANSALILGEFVSSNVVPNCLWKAVWCLQSSDGKWYVVIFVFVMRKFFTFRRFEA